MLKRLNSLHPFFFTCFRGGKGGTYNWRGISASLGDVTVRADFGTKTWDGSCNRNAECSANENCYTQLQRTQFHFLSVNKILTSSDYWKQLKRQSDYEGASHAHAYSSVLILAKLVATFMLAVLPDSTSLSGFFIIRYRRYLNSVRNRLSWHFHGLLLLTMRASVWRWWCSLAPVILVPACHSLCFRFLFYCSRGQWRIITTKSS
jgi:hypothetical protein